MGTKIRNFYKGPMLRRIKRQERTVPSKKASTRRKNARNHKRKQLGERKAQSNNGVGNEKVKKKEKKKGGLKTKHKKTENQWETQRATQVEH